MVANQVPIITRNGTRPEVTRRLFVSIAVADLQRSIRFFESIGFTFNRQLTDASATCMLVGADVYFMLLSRERFLGFSKRPLEDAQRTTSALYSISVESREAVRATVTRALESGASPAADPRDHGYMFTWGFYDPDGHHFEVFWLQALPFSAKSSQDIYSADEGHSRALGITHGESLAPCNYYRPASNHVIASGDH